MLAGGPSSNMATPAPSAGPVDADDHASTEDAANQKPPAGDRPEPESTSSTSATKITTGKRKRGPKKGKVGKKPADMPRRPLSGYNFFFSEHRARILEEQSKVKDGRRDIFTTLGRIVANRWKAIEEKDKEKFNLLAAKDLIRYRREMEEYNDKIAKRNRELSQRLQTSAADGDPAAAYAALKAGNPSGSLLFSGEPPNDTPGVAHPHPLPLAVAGASGHTPSMLLQPQAVSSATAFGYPAPSLGFAGLGVPLNQVHLQRLIMSRQQEQLSLGSGPLDPLLLQRSGLSLQLPALEHLRRMQSLQSSIAPPDMDPRSLSSLSYPAGSLDTSHLFGGSRLHEAPMVDRLGYSSSPLINQLHYEQQQQLQQQQQQQQSEDEALRRAYASLHQQRQVELDEALRQLRGHAWPPGNGPPGRHP
jgi:hypothetical protein